MIDVSKAESITGWMSLAELAWLADQASDHDLIVEIGSFHGRSTRALGDHAKGIVIAVDTWTGPVGANERDVLPSFYDQFQSNLLDLLSEKKVITFRPSEIEFVGSPDMVFLDGDHLYAAVRSDIIYWKKKLQPGGLLCGHDYSFPDVRKAVHELLEVVVQPYGTDIWFSYV